MAKRKKNNDGDDDEWTPLLPVKKEPKNARLLAAKAKKRRSKAKIKLLPVKKEPKNARLLAAKAKKRRSKAKIKILCKECGKEFTDQRQLKNHKPTHGR